MYLIKRFNSNEPDQKIWDNVESIKIENFPWDETGYKPKTEVKLCYNNSNLFIKFKSCENQVRIEAKEFCEPSWFDSCVEFFFLPEPENDNRYFNFEINARGTLLLELDNNPPKRNTLDFINPNCFKIKTDINDDNYREFDNFKPWNIEYRIPLKFIKSFFSNFDFTSGKIIRANFYKCGDKTLVPHFGTWANINSPKPDFHRPEYFKEIIFE